MNLLKNGSLFFLWRNHPPQWPIQGIVQKASYKKDVTNCPFKPAFIGFIKQLSLCHLNRLLHLQYKVVRSRVGYLLAAIHLLCNTSEAATHSCNGRKLVLMYCQLLERKKRTNNRCLDYLGTWVLIQGKKIKKCQKASYKTSVSKTSSI